MFLYYLVVLPESQHYIQIKKIIIKILLRFLEVLHENMVLRDTYSRAIFNTAIFQKNFSQSWQLYSFNNCSFIKFL